MTFAKTDLGQDVLKNRTMPLSPKQRAMLIMVDGTKDGAQLLSLTAGMGATVEDLTELVVKGLIASTGATGSRPAAPPVAAPPPPMVPPPPPPPVQVDNTMAAEPFADTAAPVPRAADYKTAYQAGVSLTAGLGFKGFRLNMSMESASNVDEIKVLRPKLLDVLTSAHGEAKAREMMRDFDRALGLR